MSCLATDFIVNLSSSALGVGSWGLHEQQPAWWSAGHAQQWRVARGDRKRLWRRLYAPVVARIHAKGTLFCLWFSSRFSCCVAATVAETFFSFRQEECVRLRLKHFSSVGCGPPSATYPSVQLDLESGTICRWTSDIRTCHTAFWDNCWIRFYLVTGTKAQCETPFKLL